MNDLGSVSVMSISISDYIYMRQEYSAAWSRVGSMEGAVGCAQAGIVRSSSGSGPRYEEEFELRQRKWCLGIEAMKDYAWYSGDRARDRVAFLKRSANTPYWGGGRGGRAG